MQTQIGELIVGAYLPVINGYELVSYNQRSKEAGRQMEFDVLGVRSTNGKIDGLCLRGSHAYSRRIIFWHSR
jgi:hypothetical protein